MNFDKYGGLFIPRALNFDGYVGMFHSLFLPFYMLVAFWHQQKGKMVSGAWASVVCWFASSFS